MANYYGRGRQSQWGRPHNGNHYGSTPPPPPRFGGKGFGKSVGVSGLIGQLQHEISAQQQLQAIASVLAPSNPIAGFAAPPLPTNPAPTQSPETSALKQLQEDMAELKSTMSKTHERGPVLECSDSSNVLMEIRDGLAQLRSHGQPEPAQNSKVLAQNDLAKQLKDLQAELATLKSSKQKTVGATRKRSRAKANDKSSHEEVMVTKAEHKDFYQDLFQKRSVLAKVASMPLDEWIAVQAAKLSQTDFDHLVETLSPDAPADDETDESMLKVCFLKWRRDRASAPASKAGP